MPRLPLKAEVHLLTGSGSGKSTSAFGVALRALGHGYTVVVIQFMKGRRYIGEYKIKKNLRNYTIKQFGRVGWVNLKNPSKDDKKRAAAGLTYAYAAIKKKPFLLILDEVNLACGIGLLKTADVLRFLDHVPSVTFVYMTGRYAPKELMKRADFVTQIENRKCPAVMKARQGIEF